MIAITAAAMISGIIAPPAAAEPHPLFAGVLPFTDKASPEVIMRETGLSKNAFKRAVGRLYKERRIEITERAIRKL